MITNKNNPHFFFIIISSSATFLQKTLMENNNQSRFPMDSGWVETPKLRKRNNSFFTTENKKKASSVPTTPTLPQQVNHFEILSSTCQQSPASPTLKKKKKRNKRSDSSNSSSIHDRSPLSHEIITDEWDDHTVPCNELDGLRIIQNQPEEAHSTPTLEQEKATTATTTTTPPPQQTEPDETLKQISFLDYLKDELTVADFDSAQELKRERVTNFLGVPGAIEKVLYFLYIYIYVYILKN
jgi:hypothetical protein